MGSEVRQQKTVSEGWTEFQNLLLDKIEAIESSGDDTRDILDQTRLRLEGDISEIKTIQKQQNDNIERLLQIVRDGNGKTPLVLRMELAEHSIATLQKHEEQRELAQTELAKAKRNSVLSLIVAILVFLLNLGWDFIKATPSLEEREPGVSQLRRPEESLLVNAKEARNQKAP